MRTLRRGWTRLSGSLFGRHREAEMAEEFESQIGLPTALALARLVSSSLFGVTPHDGVTVMATILVLSVAAAAAGLLPAGRAARIDPIRALRHE